MKENLLSGLLHLHVSINLKNGENRRVLNVRRARNFLIKKCHFIYIYIYNRNFWNSHNFPRQQNFKKKKTKQNIIEFFKTRLCLSRFPFHEDSAFAFHDTVPSLPTSPSSFFTSSFSIRPTASQQQSIITSHHIWKPTIPTNRHLLP